MKTSDNFSPNKTKIFTKKEFIIVVVIVVILIIVAIFAIIGTQTSRHDEAVRKDATLVLSALQQYAGDHSGAYPTATDLSTLQSTYGLPEGYTYSFGNHPASAGTMNIYNQDCEGNSGASVLFYSENNGSVCIGT